MFTSQSGDTDKDSQSEDERPVPPGAPDRAPVEDPERKPEPLGDPQPPEKKRPRL